VQFAANSRRINPVVVVFRIGFTFTSHLLLRISVLTSLTLYQHAGICIMNEEVGGHGLGAVVPLLYAYRAVVLCVQQPRRLHQRRRERQLPLC